MKKTTILWLVLAAGLLLAGAGLFAGALLASDWNVSNLDTASYGTNRHTIDQAFHSILVDTDTADVVFAATDGPCRVECYEAENARHTVTVDSGVLTVQMQADKKWYDYIGIHFETPKITLYLPETDYRAVSVAASTGAVRLEALALDSLDIRVSTGAVTLNTVTCREDVRIRVSTGKTFLQDVHCENLHTEGSTGDLLLQNVTAAAQMYVVRDTGDVRLEGCDAGQLYLQTDTGDVSGTLLTPKVFDAKTDTGKVSVPNGTTGGLCTVITDTGDITFKPA